MADTQITAARPRPAPPSRPEYLRDVVASGDIGVVQKPLTLWQRLVHQAWLRKVFILVVIAAGWQLYARELNNPLLVPTFTATIDAFWTAMVNGDLPQKVANSVRSPRMATIGVPAAGTGAGSRSIRSPRSGKRWQTAHRPGSPR